MLKSGKRARAGEVVVGLLVLCAIAFSLLGVATGDWRAREQMDEQHIQDAQTINELQKQISDFKNEK
jgi:hypothetical protein